ncbi:MAG: CocE/NonD family hydrolase [Thermomicrobiales bacterium]
MSVAPSDSSSDEIFPLRRQRNVRIPMPDGVTLAADLFMPDAPGQFPVVIEYLPYRKNDVGHDGYFGHRYMAERGYVVARIDVRGTGDSEGVAEDEYCLQEQLDGVAAIAWLAEQPWSTGAVGMFGTSYGGFNSLQVAMHRPPALKAICPMYFTDNRYTDDCHYKGGQMQMLYDVGTYGLMMVGRNLLPPRPDLTGERWAGIWEGLLQNEPWLLRWLAHPTLDEQWRQGSLCENYAAIECATYLIGGWRDGYTNCTLRTYEHLSCPKKAMVGPWGHRQPHIGPPRPRIDHFREMTRFYDYWLKGIDNGIMAEPPIALYVQEYDPPASNRPHTSGFWRYETAWPPARREEVTWRLGADALTAGEVEPGTATVETHPAVGMAFGMFSAGSPLVLPGDQRQEEAYSAVFTSPPLTEPLEILGRPRLTFTAATDAPVTTFAARLCEVAPDGSSALITKGVLNAAHRASHTDPAPLTPGEPTAFTIDLDETGWRFTPGHRVRLSISHADFPNAWPAPTLCTSEIILGGPDGATLTLPVAPPPDEALPPVDFRPSTFPQSGASGSQPRPWRVTRDLMRGHAEVTIESHGVSEPDPGYVHESHTSGTAFVDERDPAHAWMRGHHTYIYRWPGQTIELQTRGQITSTAEAFTITLHVEIEVDGVQHAARRWVASYPRVLQ